MPLDKSFFAEEGMEALQENLYSFNDKHTALREDIIETIDSSNYADELACFYRWVPNIRFIVKNDPETVAFTCPDGRIFFNAPVPDHDNMPPKVWDFIHCHECLHQIWDTFEVGDIIEKEKGFVDRRLLNIASDCVINDFLSEIVKKTKFDEGVFPETIKKIYGVDYDRKVDTQYSLYIKMFESQPYQEKNKDVLKQLEEMQKEIESNKKNTGNQNGQQGQQGGQGGQGGQNQPQQPEDPDYVKGWNQALEDYENGKIKI